MRPGGGGGGAAAALRRCSGAGPGRAGVCDGNDRRRRRRVQRVGALQRSRRSLVGRFPPLCVQIRVSLASRQNAQPGLFCRFRCGALQMVTFESFTGGRAHRPSDTSGKLLCMVWHFSTLRRLAAAWSTTASAPAVRRTRATSPPARSDPRRTRAAQRASALFPRPASARTPPSVSLR